MARPIAGRSLSSTTRGAKRFPNGGAVSATNELWSLDLSTADAWDSLGTNGPGPDAPFNAALSPIPGTHALLLCERAFQTVQLWRLDLDGAPAWTKLADAPAAVANSSIALLGPTYDRRWYVLTAPADSWTFELAHPGEWYLENAPFATGPEFNPQILLSDPVTGTDLATELIGEFEDADGFHQVDSPDVWRLAPALPPVWTRVDGAGEGPSNFSAFARAYDSRRLRWILFGFVGTDMPRSTVEAWSLSVGAQPRWSKLAFDGALPAHLYGAGVAYDALRDRIVTFGGGFGQASADVNVLELSGTPRWRAIATAGAAPHSRYGSALAFDTARDRYLMFGGTTSRQTATEPEITSYHDVWSLHVGATATWDSVSTTGSRAGQWNSLAFFDPARDAMGVIGGEGLVLNPEYQDLHELSLGQVSAWDSWPDRSDSAPPGNRLGANIQMQYAVDLGLDRVVRVRNGHELWMLDRRAPTHIALLDLSPGDATNTLRADAHGLVTCAILSDAAFDARTVDPSSVTLAGAPAHTAVAADRATLRDVNGDGRLDRVLKFGRADMTLDPSVDLVALAGKTRTGEAIVGWALYNVADARAGASGDRVAGGTGFATDGDPDAPISLPAHLALTIAGPVRGAASMRLALPHAASDGVIEIFAVDGRRVARRDLGALEAGTRAIALGETSSLASGIYFARVSVAGETASARFVALR